MKRMCCIAAALFLALTTAIAAAARLSHTRYIDALTDYDAALVTIRSGLDKTFDECREAMDKADCVLRVRFTGERKLLHGCVLSRTEVLEVLKGDKALKGTAVQLYEANHFVPHVQMRYGVDGAPSDTPSDLFSVNTVCNLFQKDKEYLFFGEAKQIDGTEQGETQFVPVFPWGGLSSFRLEENRDAPLDPARINESRDLTYGEVKDNEFLVFTQEELEALLAFKRDILQAYGLSAA